MPGKRMLLAVSAVAALLAGALLGARAFGPAPLPQEGGRGYPVAAVAPQTVPPTTVASLPPPSWIATLTGPAQWSASPAGPPAGSLAATNPFGGAMVLAVVGDPSTTPGWLHVELPIRPNGSEGWIPSSGARLAVTQYRVSVSLAARTLTVTDAGKPILTTPVAIGSQASPTPPADTYLWELIRPDNPNGAYGPYIFGLAEFSDTYTDFNGGEAQIGIHGQDEPWSIGEAVSHGCIRLPNNVITQLAGTLPLGTPVTIG